MVHSFKCLDICGYPCNCEVVYLCILCSISILNAWCFKPMFSRKKNNKKQTQPTQNARNITQISRKTHQTSPKTKSLQYHVNHPTSTGDHQPISCLAGDSAGAEMPFYTGNFTIDQFDTAHVHVGTRYLQRLFPPQG